MGNGLPARVAGRLGLECARREPAVLRSAAIPSAPRALGAAILAVALGGALLACGGRGGAAPGGERAERSLAGAARGWNVVLLTIDTLRSDRLGAYGYRRRPTSPHLDAQLAAGVAFESAFSQRAATWPSLASILSGLYPSGHGVEENGYGFPDDLPTLPKLLHGAGYRTAAYLSNMCDANHQGWDDRECTGGKDGRTIQNALEWAAPAGPAAAPGAPPAAAPAAAAAAAAAAAEQRPFLLWVHLFGAHPPYYNGGDLANQLDPGYQGQLGPRKWRLDTVMTQHQHLDPADLRHLDALYDGAVIGSDRLAGLLLDGLRRAGKLDHTVVVVAADHGEELYQHNGYLYHACSVYQDTLHVPLAFAAPGLLAGGGRVPQAVELIDVLPTLLDLLGVAPPARLDGRSLVPYLERPGAGGAGKPAFSEYGNSRIHTVIAQGWKLVENPDDLQPACIPGPAGQPPLQYAIGRAELYDLAHDPGERTNLAAARPAEQASLSRLIAQRFAHLPSRARPQQVPERLRKQLTDLGYVAP
jgi:arylsulfatase A-like enzyme